MAERFWTPAKCDLLTTMWRAGWASSSIARMLGTSKNAVLGKADRLGLAGRPSPILRDRPNKRHIKKRAVAKEVLDQGCIKPGPECIETPSECIDQAPGGNGKARDAKPCQWPIGEPRSKGFHFCGADALEGKPYCEEHCERAYVRPVAPAVKTFRIPF